MFAPEESMQVAGLGRMPLEQNLAARDRHPGLPGVNLVTSFLPQIRKTDKLEKSRPRPRQTQYNAPLLRRREAWVQQTGSPDTISIRNELQWQFLIHKCRSAFSERPLNGFGGQRPRHVRIIRLIEDRISGPSTAAPAK